MCVRGYLDPRQLIEPTQGVVSFLLALPRQNLSFASKSKAMPPIVLAISFCLKKGSNLVEFATELKLKLWGRRINVEQ